jgi:pimeloyl-ACP methyl ester carboxylesterase
MIDTMAETYVLIPGAGGAAWYWHRLVPVLRRLGHHAIAVDLPAADESAGLAQYADAVVDAARGHGEVVLVAQSMGGFTAPLVCSRLPVTELVLVNAMIPSPGETAGDWWANTGQEKARRELDEREGRSPDAPFDLRVGFFHDVPADITAEGLAGATDQASRPFTEPWPLDAWPDVPIRAFSGRDDRLFPVDFQIRVARERLGLTPQVLPGGHLVALSRPEELALAITERA